MIYVWSKDEDVGLALGMGLQAKRFVATSRVSIQSQM